MDSVNSLFNLLYIVNFSTKGLNNILSDEKN
jgi:hypothetical protein